MRSFEYFCPNTLDEAVLLMNKYAPTVRVLAGGQSLLNMMKLRIASPKYIVDLSRLPDLTAAEMDSSGRLRIGSMVTYHRLQRSGLVNGPLAIFDDALSVIADDQVRHVGTVGGSCCQADPHGDMPNVVYAVDAEMEAVGKNGRRKIRGREFFVGLLQTALEPDEILVNIYVPAQPRDTGSAYQKFAVRKGDYAIISAAAVLTLNSESCVNVSLVIGSAKSYPLLSSAVQNVLKGKTVTPELISKAADAAYEEIEPEDDPVYGSSEYKRELVRTLTQRSLTTAFERARNSK